MHLDIQVLISQLAVAAQYALVGVGFVLIYRSTKVVNFAQGALGLFGGYLFVTLLRSFGGSFVAALIAMLAAAAIIGALTYLVLLRPLTGQAPLILVMLTIALSTALSAIALIIWGTSTRYIPAPGSKHFVHFGGGYSISYLNAGIVLVTAVLIGGLELVLRRSRFGHSMNATAENPLLATYRGVNVTLISAVSWAIAIAAAALAGVAYGTTNGINQGVGSLLGFAAFPAVVVGGLDSVGGVLIGAFVLAEVQGLSTVYFGGNYADVAGYIVLLLILVARPAGLFGSTDAVRI